MSRLWKDIKEEWMKDPEFKKAFELAKLKDKLAMDLLAYRRDNELSRTALANRIGVKEKDITLLEAGHCEMDVGFMLRIYKELFPDRAVQVIEQNL
jgi:DNA-binding XRE family transcriptional regulator